MVRQTDGAGDLGTGGGGTAVRLAQVADLPVVLDVPSAGRLLGIDRTRAYQLARSGGFPCRVIRVGGSWRVPTADLLALLGLPARPESGPAGHVAPGPVPWRRQTRQIAPWLCGRSCGRVGSGDSDVYGFGVQEVRLPGAGARC